MTNKAKRILLVEDDEMIQYVLDKQIRKLGYEITEIADDGVIAVEKVMSAEKPFDLILMDVRLPNMDGITATSHIRISESAKSARSLIVGLTAFAEREKCLAAGMDDFLQKPVILEELQGIIDKWILNTQPIVRPVIQAVSNPVIAPSVDLYGFAHRSEKLKNIEDKIAKLRQNLLLWENRDGNVG
ncbi:MAG: response regulator [Candidatus Melainabacteria bacterium]|nr:response regulator [Candidatus Melainabacteria bacterium]